ncbi:hypothetical protein BHE74_00015748 [Ensete ventricosum]|nr:hypothetical protein BHE74_00015748 [Ensete ventricosum]RZR81917.1 hypothetical protein BHM03_00008226 [Ensete ventricosum]
MDSKLGVDLYRGSALLEHYRGSLLQCIQHKAEKKIDLFIIRNEKFTCFL